MFRQKPKATSWHQSFHLRCNPHVDLVLTYDLELAVGVLEDSLTRADLSQLSNEEISGGPVLRSTVRLLKYSRSVYLASKLGEILELLASSLPAGRLSGWIQAIGVYVMSVNKNIDSQQYKQTLKSVFPTQFETGSLADRLLIQGRKEGRKEGREEGREEGKLAGKIQTLQELLGDAVTSDDALLALDRDKLTAELNSLQERLRRRDS